MSDRRSGVTAERAIERREGGGRAQCHPACQQLRLARELLDANRVFRRELQHIRPGAWRMASVVGRQWGPFAPVGWGPRRRQDGARGPGSRPEWKRCRAPDHVVGRGWRRRTHQATLGDLNGRWRDPGRELRRPLPPRRKSLGYPLRLPTRDRNAIAPWARANPPETVGSLHSPPDPPTRR